MDATPLHAGWPLAALVLTLGRGRRGAAGAALVDAAAPPTVAHAALPAGLGAHPAAARAAGAAAAGAAAAPAARADPGVHRRQALHRLRRPAGRRRDARDHRRAGLPAAAGPGRRRLLPAAAPGAGVPRSLRRAAPPAAARRRGQRAAAGAGRRVLGAGPGDPGLVGGAGRRGRPGRRPQRGAARVCAPDRPGRRRRRRPALAARRSVAPALGGGDGRRPGAAARRTVGHARRLRQHRPGRILRGGHRGLLRAAAGAAAGCTATL